MKSGNVWRSGFLDLKNRVKIRKSRFEDQLFLIWRSGFTIEKQGDQDQVEIRKSNPPILRHILILIADAKFSTNILGLGQFVKKKRGNAQLVDLKGFCYKKTKISRLDPHRVFWICTRRSRYKCTARATTEGLNIISVGNHTHDPKKRQCLTCGC